jgi:gliding motility-associated-like protein
LRAPAGFHVSTPDSVGACPPELVDLTSATLNQGSTPGLRFSYFTDATLSSYAQDPTRVDRSGLYYIKAASAEGCIDMKTIRVVLDTVPKMTVNPPPPYYYPQNADLTKPELVNVADPTLIFSYWKDPSTTIAVSKPGAVEIAGTYYIKASSRFGCSVVEPVEIVMQIPPPTNVFSPNGDGINDVWETPALNKYNDCVIDIYDRTGRPVYHSVGYGTPWNGMANGKPLPVATYYYVIKASDRLAVLTGSITLLR